MLRVEDGRVVSIPDTWKSELNTAHLHRAIRGTARIDTPGAAYPFIGTAFAVARRLAVTADYIGAALLERARSPGSGEPVARLDFGEAPPSEDFAVGIAAVEMIHPHWKAAFLVLDDDVPDDRILALASSAPEETGRKICVVGYPSNDVRNDPKLFALLLGDVQGVKRVMPGTTLGVGTVGFKDPAPAFRHDASTMGGTGGAPVIDLADGTVLGLQHSGRYLIENQAAPAWQLRRDPQWAWLWDGRVATAPGPGDAPPIVDPAATSGPLRKKRKPVFAYEQVLELTDLLIENGFERQESVELLLTGLPPEMLATLPTSAEPRARLLLCLEALSRMRFLINERLPVYYVLLNAKSYRKADPDFVAALQAFLDIENKKRALD